jgi:hypothetical protein
MNLSQAELAALITARPEGYFGNTPVYRGVSTSGQIGGAGLAPYKGMTTGPGIDYGQLFSGITGAIATGVQEMNAAEAKRVPLMTVPDKEVAPRAPLAGFTPVVPDLRTAPLRYQRLATA